MNYLSFHLGELHLCHRILCESILGEILKVLIIDPLNNGGNRSIPEFLSQKIRDGPILSTVGKLSSPPWTVEDAMAMIPPL